MKKALVFILFASILLASCSEDEIIDRREHRLTGTWEIERSDFGQLTSPGFRVGDHIEFHTNYTISYEERSGSNFEVQFATAEFNGTWEIFMDDIHDEECPEEFLTMNFNEVAGYTASLDHLTHRKLKMTITLNGREYKVKLLKT